MARPLRIQYPGAFYHVTSRGNEGKAIFKSKGDREKFLSYLESAHERYGAIFHVYCLMSNHYHLLLETPGANLSEILHHINGAYTNYYNARKKRYGHLFQGRYKAVVVEKDAYCQEFSRYIHLNPVRSGLAKRPSDYPWSSYPFYIGLKRRPGWLTTATILGYFGKKESSAQKQYRRFVEKAVGTRMESPLKAAFASTFLGSEKFINWAKERRIRFKDTDTRDIPVLKELRQRPSLKEIERTVSSVVGRGHPFLRKLCLFISQQYGGYSLREIGTYFGMRDSAVSQSNRRLRQRFSKDKKLKNTLTEIKKSL